MPDENTQDLQHCKCRIVKLIRGQMARLDRTPDPEGTTRSLQHNMSTKLINFKLRK